MSSRGRVSSRSGMRVSMSGGERRAECLYFSDSVSLFACPWAFSCCQDYFASWVAFWFYDSNYILGPFGTPIDSESASASVESN